MPIERWSLFQRDFHYIIQLQDYASCTHAPYQIRKESFVQPLDAIGSAFGISEKAEVDSQITALLFISNREL
jgi:hypothetical protein